MEPTNDEFQRRNLLFLLVPFSDEAFLNFGKYQVSGQIIATSHDLTPNGGLVREIPLFQGNLGW